MNRLTSPIESIQDYYPVVVVGSGYGGAIAASRLARAGQKVCLLERGREILPGEYPETAAEVACETQVDAPQGFIGSRTGLYDFHLDTDLSVLRGCGLGGTSLINASVSLRPEARVFKNTGWPAEIRQGAPNSLEPYFRRAEEMLKPVPYPEHLPIPAKLEALKKAAAGAGGVFFRAPINVTFSSGVNHVGVEQSCCTLCGDCVTGCNHSAKNTLLMNYLPDAKNHGAEIFTEVSVTYLERSGGRWIIHCELLNSGRELFDAPALAITADVVILGAGSLGSTGILLRSKARGLPLSERLGCNLTANADVQAFAYNTEDVVNGIGAGTQPVQEVGPVGPCITGVIDGRYADSLGDSVVIEEGAVPGAISMPLPEVLAAAAAGNGTKGGLLQTLKAKEREIESLVLGPYRGATRNTLTYLVMGHDDGQGRLVLENGRLCIRWPGLAQQPVFQKISRQLEQATQPLGGQCLTNSLTGRLFNSELITVHPLGGCGMAQDASKGVVNHKGQVFCSGATESVYENLYAMDGAVIPCALGVNPLLAISALAERSAEILASERGWVIDFSLTSPPPQAPVMEQIGLRFTETMRGYFSTKVKDDYQQAAEEGRQSCSRFQFTLTIGAADLDKALSDPGHPFTIVGTAEAAALSQRPLTVTEGAFSLLEKNDGAVGGRNMIYRMEMRSDEGRTFYFEGIKIIHHGSAGALWPETTTLYVTVYDGASSASPVLGKGILRISAEDFMRQLTTIQVTGAQDNRQRLDALTRFGKFFAGALWDTYGGVIAPPNYLRVDAPPRKRRPLRAPAPETHFFNTSDGVELRLLRYHGGSKGPVILTHGVGVSSLIFRTDTIPTNLVEFLVARGFDVWALDFRSSIELASSNLQSTADDVAAYDYPAAVAAVQELTGAPSVQMVVHCFGSVSFFMAMLSGLKGVRSAVSSQVATHLIPPPITQIKCGLYMPEVLNSLGIKSLNAYVNDHAGWEGRLYEAAMRLYPIPGNQLCNSPVCHRITFMYSQVFEHEQLNATTHDALDEMFGATNISAFEHLSRMVRMGHIVTAKGDDIYLTHLERLAIPIAFVHGGENQCFTPRSTELTYELLRDRNGKSLYTRHVIPRYGHADSILGKNAAIDVYPHIARHLEETND